MRKVTVLLFFFTSLVSFSENTFEIEKRREEQIEFEKQIRENPVKEEIKERSKEEWVTKVNRIQVEGNTLLDDFALQPLLRPYIGKHVNVYSLIHTLENNYIEKGYITTRVRLDFEKSDLTNGNISLFVVEGKIDTIFLEGKEQAFKAFVTFPRRAGKILNIRDLDQGMENLGDQSTMEIKPAEKEGYSNIYIQRKNKSVGGSINYNNLGQRETGRHRAKSSLQLHDVLGINESIELSYQKKLQRQDKEKENENFRVRTSIPFQNWLFQYEYDNSETLRTIAAHQKKYKAIGKNRNQSFGLRRLLYRNANHKIDFGAKIIRKEGKNYIDDIKLITGFRRLSVLTLDTSYMGRVFSGLLSSNLEAHFGLDKFGANVDTEEWYREEYSPKAQFRKYSFQISWYRPIEAFYYKLNLGGQYSKDILYSQEKLSLGDDTTVRGFQEESIQGDKGFYLRNEVGYKGMQFLEPYIAYDYGRAFQNRISSNRVATLQGIAVGFRIQFKNIEGNLAVAKGIARPSAFKQNKPIVYTSITYRF